MSDELREGVELNKIVLDGPANALVAGRTCERIVVRMQSGQMSGVPWAEVEFSDGGSILVNLATVHSVEIDK